MLGDQNDSYPHRSILLCILETVNALSWDFGDIHCYVVPSFDNLLHIIGSQNVKYDGWECDTGLLSRL